MITIIQKAGDEGNKKYDQLSLVKVGSLSEDRNRSALRNEMEDLCLCAYGLCTKSFECPMRLVWVRIFWDYSVFGIICNSLISHTLVCLRML
jgi:hypothetical protein